MGRIVTTDKVAKAVGKSQRHVRRLLLALSERGLVERIGQRSGWRLTERGKVFFSPAPVPKAEAAGREAGTTRTPSER